MNPEPVRPDLAAQITFLRNWAADNKAYFEDEGEVGFGRECVGIVTGGGYAEYDYEDDRLTPPDTCHTAYHKHNCLAVLGRGPEAVAQLYDWVLKLSTHGAVIRHRENRHDNIVSALLHGPTTPYLAVNNDSRDLEKE